MVRRSRAVAVSAALCAVFIAAGGHRALAQSLPRLHVLSFTLKTDARSPHLGQSFHMTLTGRLKERLANVDFVVLPNLADLEPLGDERHAIATASGTDFTETLTVAARRPGPIHVGGAYFDAVDAHDGKPKRYYSNELELNVGGAPRVGGNSNSLVVFLATLVGGLLFVFLLGKMLVRPRARASPPPPATAEPAVIPSSTTEDELASALAGLKRDRNREAVMRLRFALWKAAGARSGETLSDLLARNGARDSLQRSLQTVECAAFVSTARLGEAIDGAIAAVQGRLS